MKNKALVVIDIQNDITKNYKEIIDNINQAIDLAVSNDIYVVYIKHNNLSAGTRTFKPDTLGEELVPDMKIVSENIFTKSKGNALTADGFLQFIKENAITDFYIAGADAVACVKSTCFNMRKEGYNVSVLSDCITSYDKRKIDEMIQYYASKGCTIIRSLQELNSVPENSIAYCGLDCDKCNAYIATVKDDNALREKTAKLWSELNGVEITPEMINCRGCRGDGVKTPYCDSMCEIRKCSMKKGFASCAHCSDITGCKTVKPVLDNSEEARKNLKV